MTTPGSSLQAPPDVNGTPSQRARWIVNTLKQATLRGDNELAMTILSEVPLTHPREVPTPLIAKHSYYSALAYANCRKYADAERVISLAEANAPRKGSRAQAFKEAIFKLQVLIQLLQGKVPPLSSFENYPVYSIQVVRELCAAVVTSNRDGIQEIIDNNASELRREGLLQLAGRLPQALLRVTLRNCSNIFAEVPLSELRTRIGVPDDIAAFWAVAEGVRRGDFEATVDLTSGYVLFSDHHVDELSARDGLLKLTAEAEKSRVASLRAHVFTEELILENSTRPANSNDTTNGSRAQSVKS